MRIALAQIPTGTDPSAEPGAGRGLHPPRRRRGRADGAVPGGDDVPVRRAAGPVAEPLDGPWASGVRAIAERAASSWSPACSARGRQTAGRVTNTLIAAGPGARSALRQDSPLRRVRLHRVHAPSRPGSNPTMIDVDGVGVGLTTCATTSGSLSCTSSWPTWRATDHGARVVGRGPGKLDQWTLLARARASTPTGFVAAVDQAYPDDEIAAVGPTGVGGSLVASADRRGGVLRGCRPAVGGDRHRPGQRRARFGRDGRGVAQPRGLRWPR